MSWVTVGDGVMAVLVGFCYAVLGWGFFHTKGGFLARVDGGFEHLKEVVYWPVAFARRRYERRFAVDFAMHVYSRDELLAIAKRQPELFKVAARDAAKPTTPTGPGAELANAIGAFATGLNDFGANFRKALEAQGLQLDMDNIRAINDEKAIGAHDEHGSGVFTEGCNRCAWLADDVVRPESLVTFEDTRVQFDIRRRRVRALEDEGVLVPELTCTCINERRGRILHVRSCPRYGTQLEA